MKTMEIEGKPNLSHFQYFSRHTTLYGVRDSERVWGDIIVIAIMWGKSIDK